MSTGRKSSVGNKTTTIPAADRQQRALLWVFGISILLSIFGGIISGYWFLAGLPVALLIGYLTLVDFRQLFFFMLFMLPLSTEVTLPGGFGTDLPAEPFMVLLCGVFLVFLLKNGLQLSLRKHLLHPITLALLLHYTWIFITSIGSADPFVSIKFFLAKTWYIVTFFVLAAYMVKSNADRKKFFWWILVPLLFTVAFVVLKHATMGFSFADSNRVVRPFYRNHVNYASLLVLFLPYVWAARYWYRRKSRHRRFLLAIIPFLLVAIQLSYTRAAYVALLMAIGVYFIIQLRLMKPVLVLATAAVIGFSVYMIHNDKYLDYAPEYKKTVSHYNFDNLLEATYKGEDVSTMERVYRWVAGMHMFRERPFMGFGPGNFYNFYRSYTVTSFVTYVSDNPEKSGIHSYYLMTLVEQGVPGLIFFALLCMVTLVYGERIYHQTKDGIDKHWVMACTLSYFIILALLLINDMIETDKVGTFFFLNMAFLINQDLKNRRQDQGTIGSPAVTQKNS
jgi:O-antigen ligase